MKCKIYTQMKAKSAPRLIMFNDNDDVSRFHIGAIISHQIRHKHISRFCR